MNPQVVLGPEKINISTDWQWFGLTHEISGIQIQFTQIKL
jgi:hypothetical protein